MWFEGRSRMHLKSRIVSVGAALALVMTMTTGVWAQDSVGTTITLAKINCSASLSDAQVDLGLWLYDPSAGTYSRAANTGQNAEFTVTASGGVVNDPSATCLVEMTASDLVNAANTGTGSGVEVDLYWIGPNSGGGGNPMTLSVVTGESKTVGVGVRNYISDSEFDPLTYTGTVTVTSVTAAN